MIKKQDIIKGLLDSGNGDEDVIAIINKYPDDLSSDEADSLNKELQIFTEENEILSKAYDELSDEFSEQAEMVVSTMDKAVTSAAKTVYDDLSWANDIISE